MKKSQAFTMFKSLVNLKSPRNFTQAIQINLGKLIYTDGLKLLCTQLEKPQADGVYDIKPLIKSDVFVPSSVTYPNWQRILPQYKPSAIYEIEVTKAMAAIKPKDVLPVSITELGIVFGSHGSDIFDAKVFNILGAGVFAIEIYKDYIVFRPLGESGFNIGQLSFFLLTIKMEAKEQTSELKKIA